MGQRVHTRQATFHTRGGRPGAVVVSAAGSGDGAEGAGGTERGAAGVAAGAVGSKRGRYGDWWWSWSSGCALGRPLCGP